jgi:hypothetical protein
MAIGLSAEEQAELAYLGSLVPVDVVPSPAPALTTRSI